MLNDNCKILPGSVIKLIYFTVLEKRRKVFKYSGLCVDFNRRTKYILLRNSFIKEYVEIAFGLNNPHILTIGEDISFTFKKTFKKMFYRNRNIRIFSRTGQTKIGVSGNKFYFTDFLFIFDFFLRFVNKRYIRNKYRLKWGKGREGRKKGKNV